MRPIKALRTNDPTTRNSVNAIMNKKRKKTISLCLPYQQHIIIIFSNVNSLLLNKSGFYYNERIKKHQAINVILSSLCMNYKSEVHTHVFVEALNTFFRIKRKLSIIMCAFLLNITLNNRFMHM